MTHVEHNVERPFAGKVALVTGSGRGLAGPSRCAWREPARMW